jgi:hypothetical protein
MNDDDPFIISFASLPMTGDIAFTFDARLLDSVPTSVILTNT